MLYTFKRNDQICEEDTSTIINYEFLVACFKIKRVKNILRSLTNSILYTDNE